MIFRTLHCSGVHSNSIWKWMEK